MRVELDEGSLRWGPNPKRSTLNPKLWSSSRLSKTCIRPPLKEAVPPKKEQPQSFNQGPSTHRPHGSSFLGVTLKDSTYEPQKGTTMGPMGTTSNFSIQAGVNGALRFCSLGFRVQVQQLWSSSI